MIGEWSRKISNQICENQNEKEIIQYGLNPVSYTHPTLPTIFRV